MLIDAFLSIIISFWTTLTAMSPYLLFGFFVSGVLSVFISPKFVETHLGGKGFWPVIKASLFGVPLPLCSCGVIPVTVSLRKHGASKEASISFLLSTPQTGVDSFLVTYSLLGPIMAILRPIIAFITGLVGGTAIQLFVQETPSTSNTMALVTFTGYRVGAWTWRRARTRAAVLRRGGYRNSPSPMGRR